MTDLKQLYETPGPFASVLVDVSLDREHADRELQSRVREATDRLRSVGAPEHVCEELRARVVEDPVHEEAPRSRYVVVGADGVLLDRTYPVATPESMVTWHRLPDLGPLLIHQAGATRFLLVTVDHSGGSVASYDSRDLRPKRTARVTSDEPHLQKVRGGGLAHMRFQRTAENTWRDNAREVADLAVEQTRQGHPLVVVAGSKESRREVIAALDRLSAEVAELDRAAPHDDGGETELMDEVADAVRDHVRRRRGALEAEVSQRMGQRTLVAVGVPGVARALVLGQVEKLLVDFDALRELVMDPADYPGFPLTSPAAEPAVRADLALVAAAFRTDADVVPVLTPILGEEPAVALLRWDEEST